MDSKGVTEQMELRFVDTENAEFAELTRQLDEYYFSIVGDVHKKYAKYNDPHLFACRVVAYEGDAAAGCGCWKRVDERTIEVKRIFIAPAFRRQESPARSSARSSATPRVTATPAPFWRPRARPATRRRSIISWAIRRSRITAAPRARKTVGALRRNFRRPAGEEG